MCDGEDIVLWPDGDWCYGEELESYGYNKSDDYKVYKFGTNEHTFIFRHGYLEEN